MGINGVALLLVVSGAILLVVGSDEAVWLDVVDCIDTELNAARRSLAQRWYFSFFVNWSRSP